MKCRIIFRKIPADSLRRIASRHCNKRFRISKNEARTLARHHRKRLGPVPVARESKAMPLSGNLLLVLFGLYNKRSPWAIWTRDEIRPADFLYLPIGLFPTSDRLHGPPLDTATRLPDLSHKYRYVFLAGFRPPRHPHPITNTTGMVCARPFLHLNYAEAPRNGHRLARRWDHRPALGGRDHRIRLLLGLKAKCIDFLKTGHRI